MELLQDLYLLGALTAYFLHKVLRIIFNIKMEKFEDVIFLIFCTVISWFFVFVILLVLFGIIFYSFKLPKWLKFL